MLIPDSEISPCLSALVTRKRKNQFEKSGNELSIYPLHSQGWISIIFQRSVAVGSRTVAIRDLHRTDVGVILIDTVCFINRARIIGLKGSRYKFSMKFSCCVDAFIIVHPARRSRVNLLRVCNTHPYTKWRKKNDERLHYGITSFRREDDDGLIFIFFFVFTLIDTLSNSNHLL